MNANLTECGGDGAALAGRALGHVPQDVPSPERAEEGALPEGWRMRRLGELIERPQYGLTASAMDDPSGPRFLRITDIQESGVEWTTVPSCNCDKPTLERLKLLPGDVVVARIGATTGKAHLIRDRVNAVFASYLIRLRANEGLEPEFLDCFTNSAAYWRQIDAVKGGRLKQGVNIPLLESLELALPPLPEQRAIAAVLRTAQRAKEACEQVLAATRQLKRSLLHHLFTYGPVPFPQAAHVALKETECGVFPADWTCAMLGNVASARGGTGFPPDHQGRESGEYPFFKVSDMNLQGNETWMRSANNYVSGETRQELGARAFPAGTVIFPKVGGALHTNKKRLLVRDSLLDNNVMGVTVEDASKCDGQFLFRWFEKLNLSDLSNPGPLPSINANRVKEQRLALPPLPEQREIAAQLVAVDAKLAAEDSRRSALVALFTSLLQYLMTGLVRLPEFAKGQR